jgi:hypothetical protein
MEKDSFRTFKPDATLSDFEERFTCEDNQLTLFNPDTSIRITIGF